ncbi:hypothetical protein X949_4577 [Burkholderia pseudomallei MSHR5609]|nr:hypothetical protein BURPS305_1694 [Burkholderia pseudomallei 305]KGS25241.1 hypothetical protein X941_4751 [Burkholderia pseudomallei MSHR5569]KGS41142.1 hypothetical protein X992_4761 [Burkholderia pseudomallei MSHR5492]KGS56241.1 hypothetical protein X949_4577 [Burkholderia pseudomallei MSHR5609]
MLLEQFQLQGEQVGEGFVGLSQSGSRVWRQLRKTIYDFGSVRQQYFGML